MYPSIEGTKTMDFSKSRKIIEEWRSKTKPLNNEEKSLFKRIGELQDQEHEIDERYTTLLGNKKEYNDDIPGKIIDSAINTSQLQEIVDVFTEADYNNKSRPVTNLLLFNRTLELKNPNLVPVPDNPHEVDTSGSHKVNLEVRFFEDLEDAFNYLGKEGNVISDIPYGIWMHSYHSFSGVDPCLFAKPEKNLYHSQLKQVLKKEDFNKEGILSHITKIDDLCGKLSSGERLLYFSNGGSYSSNPNVSVW